MGIHFIITGACDCLALIEILVLLTAALLVGRYILDMFRRRSISTFFHVILVLLATLPYALLDFTIGLMQLTKSNNDVYQVWAVVLVTLRYSIRATRVSGIYGKQSPLRDIMTSLWTANLLGTRSSLLKIPLWLLWSLNSFRIILGFADTELTSSRQRRHLRLITEYMRTEHDHPPSKPYDMHTEHNHPPSKPYDMHTEHNHPPSKPYDATHMKGYKYLVWGEDKQKVKSDPPEYRVRLEVTNKKKFITTNKVWEHNGVLLGERNKSNDLKDLCLAFALCKLLRRRFFGLPIHEANKQKTKELVLKGLIQNKNYDRAFKIIEAELAFLNDFFFTRYPVLFARGFPFLRFVLSLSVIGVALCLTVIFYHSSGRLADYLGKTSNGIAVTWILLLILTIKEFCEMVFYVMSDWTKVVLISNYVQKPLWRRCTPIVCLAKLLCNCNIMKRWHGILWQYNLLQSFRYKQPKLFPLNTWIPRVFFKHLPGYQGSRRNTFLNKEVKEAIGKSLEELCEKPEELDKYLLRVANSHHEHLERNIPLTSEFATETQKILVWHLATCYCEIKIKLAKTSQNTQTQREYKAATALSQYSAHLLVCHSRLLPDRSLVARSLFNYTLVTTRKLLGSCKSWHGVVGKLENLVKENDGGAGAGGTNDDKDDKKKNDGGKDDKKVNNDLKDAEDREQNLSRRDRRRKKGSFHQDSVLSRRDRRRKKEQDRARVITDKIIKVGVKLGGSLFALLVETETVDGTADDTKLWNFLEKFWARYLLHLAASVSPDDHKKLLSEGGEFLTHVWALLSHAGVLVETEQDPPSAVA